MKNQFGKLFQRMKSSRRTRENRLSCLNLESLEGRRLLAFDVPNPYQNDLINEDVSGDFIRLSAKAAEEAGEPAAAKPAKPAAKPAKKPATKRTTKPRARDYHAGPTESFGAGCSVIGINHHYLRPAG